MNTKHTRVVATLFLALATLATMGFRASNDHLLAVAILPDFDTCDPTITALTAIELLEIIDETCYTDLVHRIETEIDLGSTGTASTATMLERFYSQTALGFPVELLEVSWGEAETVAVQGGSGKVLASPSAARVPLLGIYVNAEASDATNRPQDEPRVQAGSREVSLANSIRPGYDYDSAFDLSELFKQESPSDLLRPGYNYDSAYDLSELFQ